MPLVRILVDGYSLLHAWSELTAGRPPHSPAARAALVAVLTAHHDATGTPITVVFDGQGAPAGTPGQPSTRAVEILFSRDGKTADDLIERAAHRLLKFGEVLVVTNDSAERGTVLSFGGLAMSCDNFIAEHRRVVDDAGRDLEHFNRRERQAWRRR
ncbi:MAG: NYN domain-containing protein [Limisphaerales bacterium]